MTHFTNNGGTHESGKTKNNCLIISIVEHLICLFKNSGTLQKSREDYVNDFRRRLNEKFPELAENNLGITEEHGKTLIEMIAEEFKINLTINHIEVIPDRLFSESLNPPYIENHINSTFIFERGDSIIVPVLNCETHFEGFLPKTSLD
ncbi:hypothetical protein [Paraburkholderia hayleyella]|uniref:hypothetical protein n=1 Tax=Paraburkholderia hayleyella TaxID=2152889 RepID=UPI001580F670|nr:hypothetical protein [Paraburkholderia hayleyella]